MPAQGAAHCLAACPGRRKILPFPLHFLFSFAFLLFPFPIYFSLLPFSLCISPYLPFPFPFFSFSPFLFSFPLRLADPHSAEPSPLQVGAMTALLEGLIEIPHTQTLLCQGLAFLAH